jgi:hypothetical protein
LAHWTDKEDDVPLKRRQAGLMWILVSILVAAACSKQSPPAGEEKVDRSQPGPAVSTQAEPPGGYEGFLETVSCDQLKGWAWTPSQPERPLTIDLYDGDRLLATARADQFRQDLADAKKGDGRHMFVQATPLEIKDGKPHSIHAVVKSAGFTLTPLADTRSSITCVR